ncbi:MAG: hypothetical protein HYU78_14395 [Rhodocyclales bacterium]|nr:hypothetical protein [Rhodocyclales bacterium]
MLKRLRIYYFYVALPFVALLSGAAFYYDLIARTIVSNPHPQINYAIFAIILLGGFLILHSISRQMQEARALSQYSEAVRAGADPAALQEMAINFDADIAYVLRMLAASGGRAITHQEQIAIEHELEKASTRLNSRMALPQFLSGLLVGMGLLGTFIGLLATLNDIAALISSFADIDMAKANPIDVFRTMIERMKAPMQSMGIAFSASLFGLLGSIILGLMMVGIRRCLGDILSLLGSEVAQHIEFALAAEGFAYSKGALAQGRGRHREGGAAAIDLLARAALPTMENPANALSDGAVTPTEKPQLGAPTGDAEDSGGNEASRRDRAQLLAESGGEELRVLLRIEDRLAETARLQLRTLNAEVDDFQKQRGDMLRSISEHTEAVGNFRNELQRVGRQLGTITGIMEKGNTEVLAQLSELMVRMSDDSAEIRKLMIIQIEDQRSR